MKSSIRKTTHKYGIELPTSQAHAYSIDTMNNNTFWIDSISKEMLNVGIAFGVLPTDERAPPRCNKVTGHLVFNVKMWCRIWFGKFKESSVHTSCTIWWKEICKRFQEPPNIMYDTP